MATLDDHFGDDATLPADVARDIEWYLVAGAGRGDAGRPVGDERGRDAALVDPVLVEPERRVADVVVAAQHVADLHQVVVHHIGQVVGRHSVRFQKDLIIQGAGIHFHPPADNVFEFYPVIIRHAVTNHIGVARPDLFVHFLSGKGN